MFVGIKLEACHDFSGTDLHGDALFGAPVIELVVDAIDQLDGHARGDGGEGDGCEGTAASFLTGPVVSFNKWFMTAPGCAVECDGWDQFEQVVSDVFKFVVSKYADDGESTGCVHSLDCRDAFEEGGLLGISYGSAGTKI